MKDTRWANPGTWRTRSFSRKGHMDEDVAGEQRELHEMATVIPAVDGFVKRQEALHFPLPQMLCDTFLVPSGGVGCVPQRLERRRLRLPELPVRDH